MFAKLSRRLLMSLMHKRAEQHAGCNIDIARLRRDPEYAAAIRTLARFTLDAELRSLGAVVDYEISESMLARAEESAPQTSAMVLPFRRPATI